MTSIRKDWLSEAESVSEGLTAELQAELGKGPDSAGQTDGLT